MSHDRKKTSELRRDLRGRLSALSSAERRAAWEGIQRQLERKWLPEVLKQDSTGVTLALFHPLPDEFPILEFVPTIRMAVSGGVRLLFPRIERMDPPELVFHESTVEDLKSGGGPFHLPEPPRTAPVVALNQADWVWVPGLVFGASGERIGRGKGFYDRALSEAPAPRRLATAAEFQVFPAIPQHHLDERVDWIVTERRVILPACASRQNRA